MKKKTLIKKIIYNISNKELSNMFGGYSDDKLEYIKSVISYDDKQISHFVNINDSQPTDVQINNYNINNNRELCKINNDKNKCNTDINCSWSSGNSEKAKPFHLNPKEGNSGMCRFTTTSETLIKFINKVVEELVSNELKSNEILQKDNYLVSDIVNPDRFKERPNQKIIKSINFNIQKILTELFGHNNIPQIGKNRPNRFIKSLNNDVLNNPLQKTDNGYLQNVNISNGIFRSYSNCFYWLKNIYSDISYRNLGYYSTLQTDLSNLFKSFIIDYLLNKKRTKKMITDLHKIIKLTDDTINDYLDYFIKSIIPKYISLIDLYILNQLHHIPIILYDIYDQPFLIINNGIKYSKLVDHIKDSLDITSFMKERSKYINIKYGVLNPSINSSISSVYSLCFI